MEALLHRSSLGVATVLFFCFHSIADAQLFQRREHVAQSENFIVFASSQQWATQVAQVAEQHRKELANYWLGKDLPAWSQRCPVHVESSPQLGAGGETRFSLLPGGAGNWHMTVQGTPERILDSVLPHEITHTIFATHFAPLGKYVPRWADEGACTTVEHVSEKKKHEHFLQQFLRTGRGLSFNSMFSLKDYPPDILPLYAQGHSAVQFLLNQGGSRKFVSFIENGMRTGAWEKSLKDHYAYETIGQFQSLWNKWLADGCPDDLIGYAPSVDTASSSLVASSSSPSAGEKVQFAIDNNQPAPVSLASTTSPTSPLGLSSDPAALESLVASNSGNGSGQVGWYKRRLIETNSPSQTPNQFAGTNHTSGAQFPPSGITAAMESSQSFDPNLRPVQAEAAIGYQSAARPQSTQSNGIRVLDWGNSVPVQGIQSQSVSQEPNYQTSTLPASQPIRMVPISR